MCLSGCLGLFFFDNLQIFDITVGELHDGHDRAGQLTVGDIVGAILRAEAFHVAENDGRGFSIDA